MICPGCANYRPLSQQHPITSACVWQPTPEQDELLREILPAPARSRAVVQAAPVNVEMCGAFTPI